MSIFRIKCSYSILQHLMSKSKNRILESGFISCYVRWLRPGWVIILNILIIEKIKLTWKLEQSSKIRYNKFKSNIWSAGLTVWKDITILYFLNLRTFLRIRGGVFLCQNIAVRNKTSFWGSVKNKLKLEAEKWRKELGQLLLLLNRGKK